MPLLRDQNLEIRVKNSAPLINPEYSHVHLRGEERGEETRSSTSDSDMDKSSRRENIRAHAPDTGRKYHLADAGSGPVQSTPNVFKMKAPDTIQIHQAATAQPAASGRFKNSNTNRGETHVPPKPTKSKMPEIQKTSTFDDTRSLDQSLFEDPHEDDNTAILRPQRTQQYSAQEDVYLDSYEDDQGRSAHGMQPYSVIDAFPGWQAEVADERRIQAEKQTYTPNPKTTRQYSGHLELRSQHPPGIELDNRQEPDTPSRTQSAPPVKVKVHAPAPLRSVNFATSDEILNMSPDFHSSEMAREDCLEQSMLRPSSAQPHAQSMPVHQRPQRSQPQSQTQMRQSQIVLPAHVDRFRHITDHMRNVRQETPKVSAPDSDNQDFSEDERMQIQPHHDLPEDLSGNTEPRSLPTNKRSHDDMCNGLDYSLAELKDKKLSALQAEPFPQDPKAPAQSQPTDSVGNEMTLPQILENLSKMSGDTQRETFRTLTDEQWAKTGQWFVDKFQADLKRLMEIRLERRKIAMKYEDMIRRRQRLVEYHEADVKRELHELQTGGKQLVDGRKMPSGSRSGTPVKAGR